MREIKFRALKKLSNYSISKNVKPKMVYGTGILHDKVNTWLVSNENNHPIGRLLDGDNLKLVDEDTIGQFTGLKDKNGKEIYEGDIVKGIEHKSNDIYANGVYQSTKEWDNDIVIIVDFTPSNMQLVDVYKSKCEVIGNIYENPELMND